MKRLAFGRKKFTFSKGVSTLTSTSITEKSRHGETEAQFTSRLLAKYADAHGEMEIVFKQGLPDYAIITLD